MKKLRIMTLFIVIMLLSFWIKSGIEVKAASGSSTLSVSSSQVNIGNTVKVTLRVQADTYTSFRINMSYASKVLEYTGSDKSGDCNGGGGVLSILSEVNAGGTYAITCTFQAKAAGEAAISASVVEAISMENAELVKMSGAGTKITVKSQDSNNTGSQNNTGNSNTGENQNNSGNSNNSNTSGNQNHTGNQNTSNKETLSKDNSLKKLSISNGTLSPAFQYSITKYSASVSAEVTNISVDAQTSNSKATVESITGNNNLQMGENMIKVTVKAEDGSVAVYTINVTRSGEQTDTSEEEIENDVPDTSKEETESNVPDTSKEETESNVPDTSEEETENDVPDTSEEETESNVPDTSEEETENDQSQDNTLQAENGIVIDGIHYEVSAELPEESLSGGFTKTTTTYNGNEVEAYALPYNEMTVFYLNPVETDEEENTGKFFVYEKKLKQFFPYIYVTVGNNGVVVLPMTLSGALPKGYQEVKFNMGEFEISGCQSLSQEENVNEFYLIYAVDKEGTSGWYKYDSVDMSLQRFQEHTPVIQEIEETEESGEIQETLEIYATRYQELEEKHQELKSKSQRTKAILIFVVVIAVIIIINLLLFGIIGRKGKAARKEANEDVKYIDVDE